MSDDKTMPCLMGSVLENMFVYIARTVSPIGLGLGLGRAGAGAGWGWGLGLLLYSLTTGFLLVFSCSYSSIPSV